MAFAKCDQFWIARIQHSVNGLYWSFFSLFSQHWSISSFECKCGSRVHHIGEAFFSQVRSREFFQCSSIQQSLRSCSTGTKCPILNKPHWKTHSNQLDRFPYCLDVVSHPGIEQLGRLRKGNRSRSASSSDQTNFVRYLRGRVNLWVHKQKDNEQPMSNCVENSQSSLQRIHFLN